MFASVQPPSASHKYKYLSQTQFQVQTQPQVLFSNTNSRLKYKLTDQPQPQMFSTYGIMTDNQSSQSLSTLAGRGIKSELEMPDICHNHHNHWLCKRNDEYLAQSFKIQG